ncbi:MAG: hypothetical protein ACREIT_02500 [Tepidisphaeraceae bacterium]
MTDRPTQLSPDLDDADAPSPGDLRPKTRTVLGLLVGAALVLSYLGAYAMSGALVGAELLPRWKPGEDPRLKWMAAGFCSLLATFMGLGALFRWVSKKQLARIDEMVDPEDRLGDEPSRPEQA